MDGHDLRNKVCQEHMPTKTKVTYCCGIHFMVGCLTHWTLVTRWRDCYKGECALSEAFEGSNFTVRICINFVFMFKNLYQLRASVQEFVSTLWSCSLDFLVMSLYICNNDSLFTVISTCYCIAGFSVGTNSCECIIFCLRINICYT